MEKDLQTTVLVTSDLYASIDTLCSCEAYSYFLLQNGFKSTHIQEKNLIELEQKVFEFCGLETPIKTDIFIEENNYNKVEENTEIKFICINIKSFENMPKQITPQNIQGIMGNEKPDFFDHFEENIPMKHIENVNSFSTLIAEKFKYTNTSISPQIASLLLVGIILSLNGLEESQTTNRDFIAVEYLEQFSTISKDKINALVNQL
ncbi:MAG: hypothetical protein LAT82_01895 [Nanoarchaeota archaeon]|nr:hypothetical protein [Nanoarchaeota archaeon]